MRISDWSSDVCSSDLQGGVVRNRPIYIGREGLRQLSHARLDSLGGRQCVGAGGHLDRQGRDGLAVQFGVEQIGLRTKLDARHLAQSYDGSIRISAEDAVSELLVRGEVARGNYCRLQFLKIEST